MFGRHGIFQFVTTSLAWFFLAATALGSNSSQPENATGAPAQDQLLLVEWSGTTMGPIAYKVIVVAANEASTDAAQEAVSAALSRINSTMSTYISDSEVSRFNDSESTEWFAVSLETATVVARALEISQDSNGAFDITVKPLVELWNFGAGRGPFTIPPREKLESARKRIGYQKISVRLDPPAIAKTQPDVQIDLSAIAEGHAVDTVSEILRDHGFFHFFIDIGGEIYAQGSKPNGQAWKVGIERPNDTTRLVHSVLEVSNAAVATSGDYRNFAIVDGRRYSHAIDPTTGAPTTSNVASASVMADNCITADALATTLVVAGEAVAEKLCAKYDAKYFILKRNGSDFIEIANPQMAELLEKPTAAAANSIWPVFAGALVVFAVAVTGLLIGVIVGNRPLRGSCGGIGDLTGETSGSCGMCGEKGDNCPKPTEKV